MSDGYELGTAKTFSDVSAVSKTVRPREKLGIGEGHTTRVVYNTEEGKLYLLDWDETVDGTLTIYREKSAIQNEWTKVNEQTLSTSSDSRMKFPMETPTGALLIGISQGLYRSEDWETFTKVLDTAPLYISEQSSVDRSGEIYVGGYDGTEDVWVSSDDGQTWTSLGVTKPPDESDGDSYTHIHTVAVHPTEDLMVICWGDNIDKSLEVARKDYSVSQLFDTNLPGMPQSQYVAANVFPHDRNTGFEEASFIFGPDDIQAGISRQYFRITSDDTFERRHAYSTHIEDANLGRWSVVTEIKRVNGTFIGLGFGGQLYYSHDGWFWDRTAPIMSQQRQFGEIMAIGQRHLYLHGHDLAIVPKDAISSLPDPKSTIYQGPTNGTNGETNQPYIQNFQAKDVKSVAAMGYDGTNNPSIELSTGSSWGPGGQPDNVDVIADLNGGARGTVDLSGGVGGNKITVQNEAALSDSSWFTIQVTKF